MKNFVKIMMKHRRKKPPSIQNNGKSLLNQVRGRPSSHLSIFRLLNDYFLVGILEQFEDSLNLFEKVLPNFFRGARQAEASEYAKMAMNTTRTRDKKKMSWESREYLSTGPLKYEVKIDRPNIYQIIFQDGLVHIRKGPVQQEAASIWTSSRESDTVGCPTSGNT